MSTKFREANSLFRSGQYGDAIALYFRAAMDFPELAELCSVNYSISIRNVEREGKSIIIEDDSVDYISEGKVFSIPLSDIESGFSEGNGFVFSYINFLIKRPVSTIELKSNSHQAVFLACVANSIWCEAQCHGYTRVSPLDSLSKSVAAECEIYGSASSAGSELLWDRYALCFLRLVEVAKNKKLSVTKISPLRNFLQRLVDSEENIKYEVARRFNKLSIIENLFSVKQAKNQFIDGLTGNLDLYDPVTNQLHGWTAVKGDATSRFVIISFDGDYGVGLRADVLRADLVRAGFGSGKHGFDVDLPIFFKDGLEHQVGLLDADSGTLISRRKINFGCFSPSANFARESIEEFDKNIVVSIFFDSTGRDEEGFFFLSILAAASPFEVDSVGRCYVSKSTSMNDIFCNLAGALGKKSFDNVIFMLDSPAVVDIRSISSSLDCGFGVYIDNGNDSCAFPRVFGVRSEVLASLNAQRLRACHSLGESVAYIHAIAESGGYKVFDKKNQLVRPEKNDVENFPRAVAFYLPQYHPIPENNKWWGRGFTEWRNVARARPIFDGHDQPRIPVDLGYYDLRVEETRQMQIQLAVSHGISAFCFYYYWFSGKTLLNRPIDDFFAMPEGPLKYCLCWANENWTRNWDGHNKKILISQDYSVEKNSEFIRDVAKYLINARYFRVNGRPLLLVYRILHMDCWFETVTSWRKIFRDLGHGELCIAAVRSNFDALSYSPADYGVDFFVEFPPHEVGGSVLSSKEVGAAEGFSGQIFDYESVVESQSSKQLQVNTFPGVMMGWDNTARRGSSARIYHGCNPMAFRRWLLSAVNRQPSSSNSDSLVFINAWNEWAEGTYLEPDDKFGSGYLRVVKSIFKTSTSRLAPGGPQAENCSEDVLFSERDFRVFAVGHYLGKHVFGGERSFLDMVSSMANFHVDVVLPSFSNSDYVKRLQEICSAVYCVEYPQWNSSAPLDCVSIIRLASLFARNSPDVVYVNTIVLNEPIIAARFLGLPIVIHARELIDQDAGLCKQIGLCSDDIIERVTDFSSGIVANSDATARLFSDASRMLRIYNAVDLPENIPVKGERIGAIRVGSVGSNLPKKGLEEFIDVARRCIDLDATFHVYGPRNEYVSRLERNCLLPSNLTFEGYVENANAALQNLDLVLVLSNFAESFGRSAAEALGHGVPVIGFEKGALSEVVTHGRDGFLIAEGDLDGVVDRISYFLRDRSELKKFGDYGFFRMQNNFSKQILSREVSARLPSFFADVVRDVGCPKLRSVQSVVIVMPVFNAFDCLVEAVNSILSSKSEIDFSLLVVDDASTDSRVHAYLENITDPRFSFKTNEVNAGYTRTVNLGISICDKSDVILVNSDVVVGDWWIDGLVLCAVKYDRVGTVTAMSDNAGAFSFPEAGICNEVGDAFFSSDINSRLFCENNGISPISLPTGCGFCMFISRALIDEVGVFDESLFPRGYGEENEFCMRGVSAGWVNLLAPWVYVRHRRSASFLGERAALADAGYKSVLSRFPNYGELAKSAFSSEELFALRARIRELDQKWRKT